MTTRTLTYKEYEVTVSPKFKSYAGSWASGEYTIRVSAVDANSAISLARKQYRQENGRVEGGADFRARRAKTAKDFF